MPLRTISKAKAIAMGFDATTTMLITLAMGGLTVEVVQADEEDVGWPEWKSCFGRQRKKSTKSFQSASVESVDRAGKISPALKSASKPPTS